MSPLAIAANDFVRITNALAPPDAFAEVFFDLHPPFAAVHERQHAAIA